MERLYSLVENFTSYPGVSGFEDMAFDELKRYVETLGVFGEIGTTSVGSFYGIMRCGKENARVFFATPISIQSASSLPSFARAVFSELPLSAVLRRRFYPLQRSTCTAKKQFAASSAQSLRICRSPEKAKRK